MERIHTASERSTEIFRENIECSGKNKIKQFCFSPYTSQGNHLNPRSIQRMLFLFSHCDLKRIIKKKRTFYLFIYVRFTYAAIVFKIIYEKKKHI